VAGMMLPPRMNWQQLFSYGEVVCFFSAWAVGLVMAITAGQTTDDHAAAARRFASATEVPGVQATLQKNPRLADSEPGNSASLRAGRR
jgi:hypothetical protein